MKLIYRPPLVIGYKVCLTEEAVMAEREGKWFAVAFHVGRLLHDDPDNADLKKRREEARRKHAAK